MTHSYFIVTSHGWSGSHWLATALNTHPDIVCAHSAMNLLAGSETWDEEILRKTVKDRERARLARMTRTPEELLEEVTSLGKGKVYGNVHTRRIRDLPRPHRENPEEAPYVLMNLIRHPVSLVASGAGQFRDMMEWDFFALMETCNAVNEQFLFNNDLAEKHGLNLCDADVRAFLAASYHQKHIALDARLAPTVPVIIMEQAVSDRDYFKEAVEHLTAGKVDVNEDYLEEVFDIGPLNAHKHEKKRLTPEEQFEAWLPWQREAFAYTFHNSGLHKLYPQHGYDFSFVEEYLPRE